LLYRRTHRPDFGENVQVYWNWNATVDAKGEYWANTGRDRPEGEVRVNRLQFTVTSCAERTW